ncbi:ATP-binding cassette sub-family G member 8 [Halotydeus destructor]|nr:ATP-binding cassette sub-family G member 8 [Halotydeus destructor]
MWDEREARKYIVPTNNPASAVSAFNYGYDHTEDLHAWSIYRQNLNADLSESAIGLNKSSASEKPFGNFQLKESTVNNILSHPKYGPSLKNADPYTYLRFGLPRVKNSAQSEMGARVTALNGQVRRPGQGSSRGVASDSTSATEEEEEDSPVARRRKQRVWKSNPDLVQVKNGVDPNHRGHFARSELSPIARANGHAKVNGSALANGKALSEVDLRFTANGNGHLANGNGLTGFGTKSTSLPHLNGAPKHPHLIVKNLFYELDKTTAFRRICGAQRQKLRILDNVNFEVRAGEILAIMATNALEGTAIMEVLADKYNKHKGRVKGEFILNGSHLTTTKLSELIAYVSQDTDLCPDMTTRQTVLFSTLVQKPAKRNDFDTKKRTNALLEELGLSEVRHSSVSSLTEAERKRLLIAVSLMLDTDILLLDQPTQGMDIFDTFFLVEYLRQWALISGRCVIMTIQPATYEIYTMLTRVALVSTGRVLFHGKRKDLLSYFANIDYPCPAFKNPSDYYLDLVTLDNLSPEAMLESSQRIESLVDNFGRRFPNNAISMAGPPSMTPPPLKKAVFPMQFLALWIRALIFTFPYNVIHLFGNLFLSLLLSIVCGTIYWHVRVGREQEHLWDRIGFYHAMLAVMPLPLCLITISDIHKEKQFVLNEIKQGFYTRSSYFLSKMIYSLPAASLAFVAFALPASSMAGLHQDLSWYLLFMLAYLHVLRIVAMTCAWTFGSRSIASGFFGLLFTLSVLASGSTFHYKDLSVATKWLYTVSPMRWTHEALIGWEFSSNVTLALITASSASQNVPFLCSHNPVIQQENAILIKADCGFQTRPHILSWFAYKGSSESSPIRTTAHPFIMAAIVVGSFFLLSAISVCLVSKRKRNPIKPSISNTIR